MICPNCRKEGMLYKPWLGQIWECKRCGYIGPLALSEEKTPAKARKYNGVKRKG